MERTNLDQEAIRRRQIEAHRELNKNHGANYPVPMTWGQRLRIAMYSIVVGITIAIGAFCYELYNSYVTMKNEYEFIIQNNSVMSFVRELQEPKPPAFEMPVQRAITAALETPYVADLGPDMEFGVWNPVDAIGFPKNPLSHEEFECLVEAVYHESYAVFDTMVPVAEVIINRKFNKYYPETICKVINEDRGPNSRDCQFSYKCDGKSDALTDTNKLHLAKVASYTALVNDSDITKGATHYHADYVSPVWRHTQIYIGKHGKHLFYRRKTDSDRPVQMVLSTQNFSGDHWMSELVYRGSM